jgi:hypothetical protein
LSQNQFQPEQPKLVKTQGSAVADNVWCALQDRSGNIWFSGNEDDNLESREIWS